MQNLVSNAIFISSPLLLSYFPFLSNCRVKHFFSSSFSLGKKNLNNLSVFWCIFPPPVLLSGEKWDGDRQEERHMRVFFFSFSFFSFFFEWEEREQHAEEGKKRERRMAGRRQRG